MSAWCNLGPDLGRQLSGRDTLVIGRKHRRTLWRHDREQYHEAHESSIPS